MARGTLRVALVGNPNSGKSTLFNALTGLRQHAANFPGVTVDVAEGSFRLPDGGGAQLLDLPGAYSLAAHSPDEGVALDVLLGRVASIPVPDVVVVVVDAEQLERNLFLASQILELGLPTVVALTKMDVLADAGARVEVVDLIGELGVTVVPVVAPRGEGVDHLRRVIAAASTLPRPERRFALPEPVAAALAPLETHLVREGLSPGQAALQALRLTGDPAGAPELAKIPQLAHAVQQTREAVESAGYRPDVLEAELRYGWGAGVASRCVVRAAPRGRTRSDRIDAVLMHRVWGPIIFLALMAIMFQAVFAWSQPVTDGIDTLLSRASDAVSGVLPPGDLRSLLTAGVIGGVGSVLAFVPQIFILFLFIGLLEDSGYMARAAFVMDRFLRPFGLTGKSFIPLVSGYACAVPAIMSARTIQAPRDRLATIMVVPLMSCSARLPVYALLIAVLVPAASIGGVGLQGLALLGAYVLGTAGALVVAAIFRRTLLKGPVRPLIVELPSYRFPSPKVLFAAVWNRVRIFLRRAGTVIFALSVVLWALAAYPKVPGAPAPDSPMAQEAQLQYSILGRIGHAVEPVVRPLGFDWKVGIAVTASFTAREVFVSTMATIQGVAGDGEADALRDRMRTQRDPDTGRPSFPPLVVLGLIVFYVFAPMCASTLAVTMRETGGGGQGTKWAAVQFGYMMVLAYGAALLVHQVGRALGALGG